MKKTLIKQSAAFILSMLLISSCAQQPVMLQLWKSEKKYEAPYNEIMIMALVQDLGVRASIEDEFVIEAAREGLDADISMQMFPPELGKPMQDMDRTIERLGKEDYHAIITITLFDIESVEYVDSDVAYYPGGYYDQFGNYFYYTYGIVYNPGYFKRDSEYFIECNMYELKGDKLLWTGRSKVFDHVDFYEHLEEMSEQLFSEVRAAGFIK